MKKWIALGIAAALPFAAIAQLPCTTTNASGCVCAQAGQVDCDLLPDITVSGWAVLNYAGGPNEYSQSGNGANDGRLRITGSTPNIGFGPFTVGSVNQWVCGQDTFTDYNTALSNCSTPKQLIKQKVYHKNNGTMTYTERWAGTMTYHPTHGHMHVDDWGIFTLRTENPSDPNPLNWPIVGTGAKLVFCLMDYGSCTNYTGHCRDAGNTVLTNGDFPNYGLGGMQYNCSPVEQGISSGWTDIYSESLDGMWIDIPPGTCNGDYWIVIEVDPYNYFQESNENNNWCAVPFTLTQQVPSGQFAATITPSGSTNMCAGDALTLTATQGNSYLWSNGATTQSITVSTAGSYVCTVTSQCGTDASDPIVITTSNTTVAPTATGATVCENTSAALSVAGTGTFNWYDAAVGGTMLGSGNNFNTPPLTATTDYYVERVEIGPSQMGHVGPAASTIGSGAYHTVNARYLLFDASTNFVLKSVLVDANTAGNRTIELRDALGTTVLASISQFVPVGVSRVTLNFNVSPGTDYQLGLSTSSLADMYRNSSGVNFPYTYGNNVCSITNSSAGAQYYYFFYDWEIEVPGLTCVTPRALATATMTPAPSVSFSGLAANYLLNDPVTNLVGTPAGGTFSGPGVSGNTFSPNLAGPGTHTITYTFPGQNGCDGVATMTTVVSTSTAISNSAFSMMPSVFPNPHSGNYTLAFDLTGEHEVTLKLFTLTGQLVMAQALGFQSGSYKQEFGMGNLSKGVYFLEVDLGGEKSRIKMVYQ